MKLEDSNAFAAMLQAVAEHVSTGREPRPLSSDQVIFYFEGLKHYDLEAIRAALSLHVRNPDVGHFMPKIADVVRGIDGSTIDSAARAWSKVVSGMWKAGQHQSVSFDDPIINQVVVDMGGWPSLFVSEKEAPFRQREFETRFRGYVTRGGVASCPSHLPGIAEAHNVMNGHSTVAPILIGDEDRARAILEGKPLALGPPV